MIQYDEKRARLAEELRKRVGKPRYAPMSFAQERLWFLDQFASNSAYNICLNVRLQGELDKALLENCFRDLARRHEILRTIFGDVEGVPRQVILPSADIQLPLIDLRSWGPDQRAAETERLYAEEIEHRFDLRKSPAWQVTLVRLQSQEHLLLLTMHHILSDGWSLNVLLREVAELYRSKRAAAASRLQELPIQYSDYANWQRQALEGQKLEAELAYWKEQLLGAPAFLELPVDHKRPATQSPEGASYAFRLSKELSRQLNVLSRQEEATLFMVLFAAFRVLLERYSGQHDISIGVPVAGRFDVQTEDLIGFFVNMLVVRTDSGNDPSFRAFQRHVREKALGAFAHQMVPFELLVDDLKPDRDMRYTPLFQAVFGLHNLAQEQPQLSAEGLSIEVLPVRIQKAKFDLSLIMAELDGQISGSIEYRTSLFEPATIARMAGHFETLLNSIILNPDQRISELPVLNAAERRQLLVQPQAAAAESTQGPSLGKLFAEQALKSPDAIALAYEDEKWSYRQLNQKANQLARYLIRKGAGPDSVIGVCLERSAELVRVILGILKSGAAYLPLDLEAPVQRLKYMVEDSAAPIVVVKEEKDRWKLLEAGISAGIEIVSLQEAREEIDDEICDEPVLQANEANLAYVIYTSGSTGAPKGVMIPHSNVARLFQQTRRWFEFNENDVWTLFHSYAFDFSVWEIWGALLFGGRLVVVPYWTSRSPEAFHQLLINERVTVLNQTPSAFRQLIQADQKSEARDRLKLRYVIFGGEALDPASLAVWLQNHGDSSPRLINMYGITETTVHVTFRPITRVEIEDGAGSVIGNSIPDLQVFILDSHLEPLPIGVPGELFVGGAGLARGYLNRPELTAQRFIPDPFGGTEGGRLYRTGDLARRLSNGDVEYMGRADHQVKIRGFRIELGEIESALLRFPGVREAVVVVRDEGAQKRLLAYLVGDADDGEQLRANQLRSYLKKELPEYMVPSLYVMLKRLPLTTNGKVDRQALAAKFNNGVRIETGASFAAPRTPAENVLAVIWQQVLDLESIGIDDNFFALGGDSILSLRVLAKAKEQGVQFSLQQLFEYQTIRQIAEHLDGGKEMPSLRKLEPFELISAEDRSKIPGGVVDAYPLSRLQAGMLYHSGLEEDIYHNVHWRRVRGRFNEEVLRQTLAEVVERHPILRTSFDLSTYSQPLQLVHEKVEMPLVISRLQGQTEEEQRNELEEILLQQRNTKFDFTQVPLLRLRVDWISEDRFQLTFTEHHAILDGWSVASFLTEWVGRYWSRLQGQEPDSQDEGNVFRDFVYLEQQALKSPQHQEFWLRQVEGAQPGKLPPKWRGQEVQAGQEVRANIPPEVSDGIKRAARLAGVPVKTMLLAAHLRVLGFLTGQEEVVSGLITHGRPEGVQSDRILGLFLNAVPFRMQLDGGTWLELASEVFRREREMFSYRYYPSSELQQRSGRGELFDIAFNFTYLHIYKDAEGIGDWEVEDSRSRAPNNLPLCANFTLETAMGGVRLDLHARPGSMTLEQVRAIAGWYERAFTALAKAPESRYEASILLSDAERKQLLANSEGARLQPLSKNTLLHQLFVEQVAAHGEQLAVVCRDDQLTYQQLHEKSENLALYLQYLGVKPDMLVGLCMERSADLVVGMLGILKAGGAYVPLDPQYPEERLAFMLQDSQARMVLTQETLENKLGTLAPTGAQLVSMDRQWAEIGRCVAGLELRQQVGPNHLAYVIYTSGSTGRPKGTAIEHHSPVTLVRWASRMYGREELTGVLASTSVCFDLSIFEMFVPLANGGTIIMAASALGLVDLPNKEHVTLINTVPSAMEELVRMKAIPDSVRTINLAGEPLSPALVDRIYDNTSAAKVYDLYGPSETTTYSTFTLRRKNSPQSIGCPVSNTQIYVLDRHNQLQPIGVPGELHIAGDGVARGYLNRPELTEEKFIANPFVPGARMYKTGDLARWLEDGTLQYLGRIDAQVKIRGFRIEPGEVETVLATHPRVRESAVVPWRNGDDLQLAAYVVLHSPTTTENLRQHLEHQLPSYMLPAVIVQLKRLPQTPNGKIDRKRLPVPQAQQDTNAYVAPVTLTEEKLSRIWSQVLRLERVSTRANFFHMGGHSLAAARLVALIEQQFSKKLPLVAFFQNPTIAQLARFLEGGATRQSSLIALQSEGSQPPFFCVHPVGGTVFCYTELSRQLGPAEPFYALQSPGLNANEELLVSIPAMAAEYITLMRSVQKEGPYRLGGWSMGGVIAFEMARQLEQQGIPVELVAMIDSSVSGERSSARADVDEAQLLAHFALDLGLRLDRIQLARYMQNKDEAVVRMIAEAKQQNALPADFDAVFPQRLFEIFKNNLRAAVEYVPQPYHGKIIYFEAQKHPASRISMARIWKNFVPGGIEVYRVPGDHYTIMKPPNIQVLARKLAGALGAAPVDTESPRFASANP
jgi:amino acid adenylation domain-containing protein